MKLALILIVALIVVAGYATLFRVSTVDHNPDDWHVDPLTAIASKSPNSYRVAPSDLTSQPIDAQALIYNERPLVLAQAFDQFALTQRDTLRIAGLPSDLMMTYVQTSRRLKMPDYITVKFIELDENLTTIAIFSRARFGYGDLGVNRRRIENWLKPMSSFEVPQG